MANTLSVLLNDTFQTIEEALMKALHAKFTEVNEELLKTGQLAVLNKERAALAKKQDALEAKLKVLTNEINTVDEQIKHIDDVVKC